MFPIFVDSFPKVEGQNMFPPKKWDVDDSNVSGLSHSFTSFRVSPAAVPVLFCSLNRRPIIFASSWIEATRRDSAGAKMGRSWPPTQRRLRWCCFGPWAGNFTQEKDVEKWEANWEITLDNSEPNQWYAMIRQCQQVSCWFDPVQTGAYKAPRIMGEPKKAPLNL